MFHASIQTESLHRIIYNARLFQVGKHAKPTILEFTVNDTDHTLTGTVDDNYTYIREWANCSVTRPITLNISATSAKHLELNLRDVSEDYVDLEWTLDGGLSIMNQDWEHFEAFEDHDGDKMADVFEWDQWSDGFAGAPFALNADRFRKLSLIKPGDYPIDLKRIVHARYGDMILFKAGPKLRGALTTLDRKILCDKVGSRDFMW